MTCFLTGTDTGVGKTHVAAAWVRALRAAGRDAVGLKPICCGGREDAEALHAAADGVLALNAVNPVWFRAPVAPYAAAMIENRPVDLALIREAAATARARHEVVVIEGVGGWLAPIAQGFAVRELAVELGLPVVIVVANRLGALNHALLTFESVCASGLLCPGFIFNQPAPANPEESAAVATNRALLEDVSGARVLFEMGYGQRTLPDGVVVG